ncbi:hypothetical protein [Mycoplasma procyoni]|uniref:hypothetical protein n=1 Tax=Mycoplasma procyoni TaxID=568784 RepID=UPI00197B3786|nr:hypothetical protein [Mycoplasma procyoni]MBN3534921.1 hypothetical protein [Mycoplasma procyoni]
MLTALDYLLFFLILFALSSLVQLPLSIFAFRTRHQQHKYYFHFWQTEKYKGFFLILSALVFIFVLISSIWFWIWFSQNKTSVIYLSLYVVGSSLSLFTFVEFFLFVFYKLKNNKLYDKNFFKEFEDDYNKNKDKISLIEFKNNEDEIITDDVYNFVFIHDYESTSFLKTFSPKVLSLEYEAYWRLKLRKITMFYNGVIVPKKELRKVIHIAFLEAAKRNDFFQK